MEADGLVLAGGKARRMGGLYKGGLIFGEETFTEVLVRELKMNAQVQKVWLSYGGRVWERIEGCGIVRDLCPGCGPVGGLYAGLLACERDIVCVAACDMPFLKGELYSYLYGEVGAYDGVVPAAEGKVQPLAAIYKKSAAPILREQIKKGNYRMQDALKRLDILYIDVTGQKELAGMFKNINTLQEYDAMIR